jgi:hypothetical protein
MGRKRTLNYRDFRGDFDESEEGRKKKDEEDEAEGDEDEDEDEEEDEEEEGEAAEEEGGEGEEEEPSDEDDGEAPKKKPRKKKEKVEKPKRVKKPRAGKVVRLRVVWKVLNNSNQPVASYDYSRKGEAEAHAKKLQEEKKQTFFVQPVKEPIEEKEKEAVAAKESKK